MGLFSKKMNMVYKCPNCGHKMEAVVKFSVFHPEGKDPKCPKCGTKMVPSQK